MKLFQIMMFLLIFNVSITVVGALHIYNLGTQGSLPQDATLSDLSDPSSGLWIFLGQSITALITGAIAGAVIYSIMKIPTAEGAAYGFFASFITLIFYNTYRVLWSIVEWIQPQSYQTAVAWMVGLFLGISGLLTAMGFLQLVRGSMASYL